MKRTYSYILIFSLLFLLSDLFAASKPIAIVLKARGSVTVQYGKHSKKIKAKRGTKIYTNTKIITRTKSYAAVIFIEDRSLVRVRPNSSCTFHGKREKQTIAKNVFLEVGTIFCKITKQKRGRFRVTTPTSVASVKGTAFWTKQEFKGATWYFGEEGEVEISTKKGWALLRKGKTGYVGSANSKPIVRETKPGEKPTFGEEETKIDEFQFEFQNDKGQTKSLKFKVKRK